MPAGACEYSPCEAPGRLDENCRRSVRIAIVNGALADRAQQVPLDVVTADAWEPGHEAADDVDVDRDPAVKDRDYPVSRPIRICGRGP